MDTIIESTERTIEYLGVTYRVTPRQDSPTLRIERRLAGGEWADPVDVEFYADVTRARVDDRTWALQDGSWCPVGQPYPDIAQDLDELALLRIGEYYRQILRSEAIARRPLPKPVRLRERPEFYGIRQRPSW